MPNAVSRKGTLISVSCEVVAQTQPLTKLHCLPARVPMPRLYAFCLFLLSLTSFLAQDTAFLMIKEHLDSVGDRKPRPNAYGSHKGFILQAC